MVAPLFLPYRKPAPIVARPAPLKWTLRHFLVVGSTNDIASRQAPWTAVIARRQLAGRGRYRRHWTSDEGGLWLSAVVPTPGPATRWAVLPLAAGWAVREFLVDLGLPQVRLRWPNDVMVGPAKLAGILVERFAPDRAVIGIGLNLRNRPEAHDPALTGQVARLSDLLPRAPRAEHLTTLLLDRLATAHAQLAGDHLDRLLPELNRAWTGAVVRLDLVGETMPLIGRLVAVDASGALELLTDRGVHHLILPARVERLRELPSSSQ